MLGARTDDAMKNQDEPSAESLEEMPEIMTSDFGVGLVAVTMSRAAWARSWPSTP